MEVQFLRKLLDNDFYVANKSKVHRSLFEDDELELYDIISEAHDKYGQILTTDELFALWQDRNPVATSSVTKSIKDLTDRINEEDTISDSVASDLLNGLWQRNTGKKISQLGINLMEGKPEAFDKLLKIVDQAKQGFLPTDFGDDTSTDLALLLQLTSDENRFQFNIPGLSRRVYGIGRGEFGIFYARPETGKTAFGVSLCFGPNGFADQGRRVVYLGNEEATERTMLRAYQAYTGMTRDEIVAAPHLAKERFELIEDKVSMKNIQGWPMSEVKAYVKHKEADVVIVDQMDKVTVDGSFNSTHEKLREVYIQAREMMKECNCAGLAVSQASADAEGKTKVTPDMMEGSKTGKFAEVDLAIGIGKFPDNPDGTPETTRILTIGKNKISGWHGEVTCKIEPEISRYVD